ncbi:MAG TPA: AraC family transcriptional regulator [Puia sp.]|uniref:AraC family transcriptional regulator n=1 Tax=Puia sp. TaxID=2045100 RepID=UPI002B93A058|nr:AraC family transcriptional regulator [Puia sp.]HVU99551.1 AraC family transcriptional regulator [Puia sp.]
MNSIQHSITRIEEAQPQPIHRHEHFELIYLNAGQLDCKVDMEEYALSAGDICLIRPGSLHHFTRQNDPRGFLLCFASRFGRLSQSLLQVPKDKQAAMTELLGCMKHEQDHGGRYRSEALGEFLKIFLIYLSRLSAGQPRPCVNRATHIFDQFMDLLEKKYSTHHRPADYSEELFLSTSYLNQTIKAVSGRTTSYHIHQRVVLEAQRMAVYANSSLKEAASNLGFEDICHFSRFFKKAAGQSFKEFKQRAPH